MLRKTRLFGAFLVTGAFLACDRPDAGIEGAVGSDSAAVELDITAEPIEVTLEVQEIVGRVADVATAIEDAPERAAEILADHGLTRERLDSLVFEIASRESWTDAFLEALGR